MKIKNIKKIEIEKDNILFKLVWLEDEHIWDIVCISKDTIDSSSNVDIRIDCDDFLFEDKDNEYPIKICTKTIIDFI